MDNFEARVDNASFPKEMNEFEQTKKDNSIYTQY